MLVFENNIPDYLRSSPFLQGMLSEGPFPEAGIEIPDGCLKQNMEVVTHTDLMDLFHTLRFWLLPEVLENCLDLLKFAWSPVTVTCFLNCSFQFLNEFPFAKDLFEIILAKKEHQLSTATLSGRMQIVRYMVEELHFPVTDIAGVAAAKRSDLQCLDFFRSHGMKLSKEVCFGACLADTLSIMQYMVENKAEGLGCLSSTCARNGNFETLKYVIEQVHHSAPCHISMAFEIAAEQGHIGLLSKMRSEWQDPVHGRYDSNMVFYGAQHGQLDVLKFARDNNVSFQHFQDAVCAAARAQDVHCLQYLHELGCALTEDTLESAAYEGHLPVLRYLFEHDCPGSEEIYVILADGGNFDCFKYAHERGCPWDERTCHIAAAAGHLECLRYAHENGCPWVAVPDAPAGELDISLSAARAPRLDCLLYVLEQGVSLHPQCGRDAARSRSPETLRFLHERGFTWNEQDCAEVASSGSLECLKYLREICTPWDARTCANAASYGQLECLKYAHENGCPWDEKTTRNARYDVPCYEYAVTHGCPVAEKDKG